MDSPMPRDSLGRIVYVGDDVGLLLRVYGFDGDCVLLGFHMEIGRIAPSNLTVDLAASPERTNYERYFADLGTRSALHDAIDDACSELGCYDCPLDEWPELSDFGRELCLSAFFCWLDEKAVI